MSIKRYALTAIFLTYVLIVFGGYVASSKSGMGCGPEWPLCNGEVIPILQGETLIEFTHRVIGAILGIVSFILFFLILRTNVSPKVRTAGYWMILLLVVQVLLGAAVVLKDLPTSIIAGHLIVALLFLASLIWIFLREEDTATIHLNRQKSIRRNFGIVLLLLLLTFGFGAYVKHESLGLVCGSLSCGNSFFPMTSLEWIHTIHRGLAFIVSIYLFILVFLSFKKSWGEELQNRLILSAITVVIQIVLGVLTIFKGLELSWAVLHVAIGTLLFALVAEAYVYAGSTAFLKSKRHIMTKQQVPSKTEF